MDQKETQSGWVIVRVVNVRFKQRTGARLSKFLGFIKVVGNHLNTNATLYNLYEETSQWLFGCNIGGLEGQEMSSQENGKKSSKTLNILIMGTCILVYDKH